MRWERGLEMFDLSKLNEAFSACGCGRKHECLIKDIRIGEKLVGRVGAILKENGFPEKLLLVADENTLSAARGILESLQGFDLVLQVYRDFRIPRIEEVERISERISEVEGVLVVGTGSLTDVCRLACHRKGRPLAVFATAPSMDGFASNSSPIIFSGFKRSVPAKAPDVVIADAEVLAASPWRLQAAGFGDMIENMSRWLIGKRPALSQGKITVRKSLILSGRRRMTSFPLPAKRSEIRKKPSGFLRAC